MRTYAEWLENPEGMTLAEAVVKGAVDAKTVPEGIGRPTEEELGRVAGYLYSLGHPLASHNDLQAGIDEAARRLGGKSLRFEIAFTYGYAESTRQPEVQFNELIVTKDRKLHPKPLAGEPE